jgi:hypothetical protein
MSSQQLDRKIIPLVGWVLPPQSSESNAESYSFPSKQGGPLSFLRQKLDQLQVRNSQFAHFVCKVIPPQCPFERDVKVFGKTLFHIPPLCKLNPLYEEVVGLRFRALCYLADECGEDISCYC